MALFPQRSVEVSPELRRLFGGLPSSPSAPLSVILAHDEITPGAVLRPDNARKFVSFYFSFCEFGDVSIRYELGWFHLAVLRSSVIDKVDGGMSAALRHLLRALLMDAGSLSGGVVLPLESGPTMLFARLKNHLGDEAALSHGLSSKTASGLRPCIKCANVLKKHSGLAARRPGLVEINCTDLDLLVPSSDSDIWQSYDRLVGMVGTVTKTELEKQQMAAGGSINSGGVLADIDLRRHFKPASSLTYDWQHTYLCNGIAGDELHNVFGVCRKAGLTNIYSLLEQYCAADWSFPLQHRGHCKALHQVFNKTREKASSDHWKASASELLGVYPLVRRFAESVVLPRFPHLASQVQSLLLCFHTLDLLQDSKGGVSDNDLLKRAVQTHLQKHKLEYGEENWRPKLHYGLHIPEQVRRDGRLYDCFVVERSHQLPRLLAGAVKKTSSFERSVIARSLLVRLRDLETWSPKNGLQGSAQEFPELALQLGLPDLQISASAVFCGMQHGANDFVLVGDHVLSFVAAVRGGERLGVLGHVCNLALRHSRTAAEWQVQKQLSLLWVDDQRVRCPAAWNFLSSGNVLLLLPDLGGLQA